MYLNPKKLKEKLRSNAKAAYRESYKRNALENVPVITLDEIADGNCDEIHRVVAKTKQNVFAADDNLCLRSQSGRIVKAVFVRYLTQAEIVCDVRSPGPEEPFSICDCIICVSVRNGNPVFMKVNSYKLIKVCSPVKNNPAEHPQA